MRGEENLERLLGGIGRKVLDVDVRLERVRKAVEFLLECLLHSREEGLTISLSRCGGTKGKDEHGPSHSRFCNPSR